MRYKTAIETGMRWGELIALRPRHIDFLTKSVTVEQTIIEVSRKHSPTGERYVTKAYPKDNEPRTFGVDDAWLEAVALHISIHGIGRDRRCSPLPRAPRSLATPSAPASGSPPSKPASSTSPSGMDDLRHAHAFWLLAEGSDLSSVMEMMAMPRSKPPRSTSTPFPKPTAATSTPLLGHVDDVNNQGDSRRTSDLTMPATPVARRPPARRRDPAD